MIRSRESRGPPRHAVALCDNSTRLVRFERWSIPAASLPECQRFPPAMVNRCKLWRGTSSSIEGIKTLSKFQPDRSLFARLNSTVAVAPALGHGALDRTASTLITFLTENGERFGPPIQDFDCCRRRKVFRSNQNIDVCTVSLSPSPASFNCRRACCQSVAPDAKRISKADPAAAVDAAGICSISVCPRTIRRLDRPRSVRL